MQITDAISKENSRPQISTTASTSLFHYSI